MEQSVDMLPNRANQSELINELARLRRLIEVGNVETARALARQLCARWPESTTASYFHRVMAPAAASVRPEQKGRSLQNERAWLLAHAHQYPGCWIAVKGDQMIAANPDLIAVLEIVEQASTFQDAVIHFQRAADLLGRLFHHPVGNSL